MKKIITVLGARPQFIKASVVSEALRNSKTLKEVVVHTGQHFDHNMSDIFFRDLGMSRPDYSLDIHGGHHGAMTGAMLAEIERILLAETPDAVLVYGDTNSTLAGALAAVKLHIPIAHVEAGLRSFNLSMPEEINRILTDRISRWLFTPTAIARTHLEREGVDAAHIFDVGDVMFDVAIFHGGRVTDQGGVLGDLGIEPRKYALATVHRAENTDDPHRLKAIVDALGRISARLDVVWPLHPRTRAVLQRNGDLARLPSRVRVIDPVGYLDMVQLEKHAAVIATDSGGVQKEAFFHQVPCVTLRDETEWVELVDAGWNRIAPPLPGQGAALGAVISETIGTRGRDTSPYGAGNAATLIVSQLERDLGI